MNTIDLLLINPSNNKRYFGSISRELPAVEPPVITALVASYARTKGYTVAIIDAEAQGWSASETAAAAARYEPLLIAIAVLGANPSASSTPKMAAVEALLAVLSSHAKTALFGIHPSALPAETLCTTPVDFICRGECFETIISLLSQLKAQPHNTTFTIPGLWYADGETVIDNGWGVVLDDIDQLHPAAWDLLPMERYTAHNWHCFGRLDARQPYAAVYTSFGCPFSCDYCNIHTLYDGKPGIRYRSTENVRAEIDMLVKEYGINNIKLLDELFLLDEERVRSLCEALAECTYDLNIWAYARIDQVNRELLSIVRKAGIRWLCYGIEAANTAIRSGVAKGGYTKEQIKEVIRLTHDAGIYVIGNFMFGLPGDTRASMQETLALAKELQCEYVNFYTTMAYPGSSLYTRRAAEEGLLPAAWLGYGQLTAESQPLSTAALSSHEIRAFRDQAFQEYVTDAAYRAMIQKTFGTETLQHIKDMSQHIIRREALV